MPTDVFKYLFDGKGVDVGRGYKEYSQEVFDCKVFKGVVLACTTTGMMIYVLLTFPYE